MGDVLAFPAKPYWSRVYHVARWLSARRPETIEKNWRTEVTRYEAALLVRGGISPLEASQQALQFGDDVMARLSVIKLNIVKRPSGEVCFLRDASTRGALLEAAQ